MVGQRPGLACGVAHGEVDGHSLMQDV
jgi:hypothetical protein